MFLRLTRQLTDRIIAPLGYRLMPIEKPRNRTQAAPGPHPFFVPSSTCQISSLGTIYEKFFGPRSDGVFVEVGAFDGEAHSNTSCLADLGWSGYYVEPVPEFYEKCRIRHRNNGNTQVFNLAIGKQEGEIEIHVGGVLSTANQQYLAAVRRLDRGEAKFRQEKVIRTRQLTLDGFLEQIGVPSGFDLLVVDVEGLEPEVFAGFDLRRWRPLMMIVEISDTKSDLPHAHRQYAQLFNQIVSHSYFVVYKDSINTIFLATEHYRTTFDLE